MRLEQDLLQRIENKDKDSLTEIYDCYIQYIYRLLTSRIDDSSRVEKIIKELFEDIWNDPQSYSHGKYFSSTLTKKCLILIRE
ncbi:hypothetical protein [Halobacillus sp. BAB-2008]|uniref:hypothetical protein n=1 Tax=Halobacillus sp. BAB-2008 TaxID=1246484 RepID=UPI0002A4FD17|nr:hypothetical protein [Halobacillus sp. BAB-2008]ELK45826.1 hypothetical protein D479_13103 [Halobacillus sp. BAB-2008]